jgi:hypothetical protein
LSVRNEKDYSPDSCSSTPNSDIQTFSLTVPGPTDLLFNRYCKCFLLGKRWLWHDHYIHIISNILLTINQESQKLSKNIYLIKSLRDSVSQPVLRSVYLAKFESMLKYGVMKRLYLLCTHMLHVDV